MKYRAKIHYAANTAACSILFSHEYKAYAGAEDALDNLMRLLPKATGGHIEKYVDGQGWVVCEGEPESEQPIYSELEWAEDFDDEANDCFAARDTVYEESFEFKVTQRLESNRVYWCIDGSEEEVVPRKHAEERFDSSEDARQFCERLNRNAWLKALGRPSETPLVWQVKKDYHNGDYWQAGDYSIHQDEIYYVPHWGGWELHDGFDNLACPQQVCEDHYRKEQRIEEKANPKPLEWCESNSTLVARLGYDEAYYVCSEAKKHWTSKYRLDSEDSTLAKGSLQDCLAACQKHFNTRVNPQG